ncbi:hypothetical protein AAHC03_02019 [Spirometra sp. Aus1]
MPGSAVLLVIWLSYATSGLSSRFSRFDVTFAVSNSSSKWSTSVFNLSATESVFGDPSQKETPVNYSPTILGSLFRVHGELRRKLGSKCPNTLGASSKCAFACYIQSLNPIITSLGPKIALVVEEKKNSSCTLLSLLDFSLHFTNASAVLVLHGGKGTPNLTGLFPKASDPSEGRNRILSQLIRKPDILVIFLSLAWFPELPALLDNPQVNVSATIQLYSQTSSPSEDPLEENSLKRFIAYGLFLLLFALFLVFIIFCLARLGFRLWRGFRLAHSRSRRSRKLIAATKKVLKRLPVRHLQPVDPMISTGFDQCAICIELFQPQDVIRTLPCKRQHRRPGPYRDSVHVINPTGYSDMPIHHPVHFRLNSLSNSSEFSTTSFIQQCRTAEALACENSHSAKMPTHRWYSKQQLMRGYIATAAAATSSSLSSSSSEKRGHYRYRTDQRFPTRGVWRLSRFLSRRSRGWCFPWCFIRYAPVARRPTAPATPVCEPEKVEHSFNQPSPAGATGQNLQTVCVHLLPYSRCHQPPSCYQLPPLPAAMSAVDSRQRSVVPPDYTCCNSPFQPVSTLAPNPMACPGYYRACVHSHLPVNDFACGVRPVATNNMVVAVSSRNNLREEKMALPSGDRLPSYDQVTESGLRLVKAPSIEGSTTSGSDEIRPLSPPTPDLPGKRVMQLPLSGSRPCEVSNPCAAFIPTSAGVSTTSCSVLPMIVKVDVLDQPPLPPPPPPPPSLHCVSSPDLRPRPEAADALQLRFLRPGCVHQSSSVIPSVHDNSLPRDLPPPAYSEIVASPDVKFAPNPNSTAPCDHSGGDDHGAILRDPMTSKPLKKAVRFFAHTLASMGFATTSSSSAASAAAEQKSCSNVPYCVQTHQPPPMGPTSQRYAFPSTPPMCKSCAALGYQRHPRHPYYYVAQSTKSDAAPASAGVSRYHRHHFRNKRGGGAGAVRRSWRDSRASSHRIAKTIELDPTGVIKGFPKSSSSSGSMSSASSQQQWKQAQQTHPSSILVNSGPVRAHFRNVKVTVEPQSQNPRKCEPLALETRGGRILRTYSLPNCLQQSPHSPDVVTFDIVAAEHTKHSPNRASVPNLHN